MSFLARLLASPADDGASTAALVAGTVVVTTVGVTLLRSALWPPKPKIIEGPLRSVIPTLSETELRVLNYKPDEFPGARDVPTPYGTMRVYEWGPESGPKVLFIHGINTSCQTMGPIAHALVSKGCRVMLFDLFGRGFSDGVGDLPQDARLYVSQALLALASSSLPWTGTAGLRLVGYSLGGGVAAHFAASFPHLVEKLVLLAPAGLIRVARFGTVTRFIFTSGLVPDVLLTKLTRRRLQQPIAAGVKKREIRNGGGGSEGGGSGSGSGSDGQAPLLSHQHHHRKKQDIIAASLTEASDPSAAEPQMPIEKRVLAYVQWMVRHHDGFIPTFLSSLTHAPLIGQHEVWERLGATRPAGSTVVVMGNRDEIVDAEEYEQEGLPLLGGRDHVQWAVVEGGHDFPMTHTREALAEIYKNWGME